MKRKNLYLDIIFNVHLLYIMVKSTDIMKESTDRLTFGGPLLKTPPNSVPNTRMGKRRRRSNSINDSSNSSLQSPDRTYNISSKTGPNDQNYEEISRQFNDHKERRLLAAFEDNKP
mgnify:CR=1 FL=1